MHVHVQDEGRFFPWTAPNRLWMTNITFQGGNLKRDCTKCALDNYNARFLAQGMSPRTDCISSPSSVCGWHGGYFTVLERCGHVMCGAFVVLTSHPAPSAMKCMATTILVTHSPRTRFASYPVLCRCNWVTALCSEINYTSMCT